MEGDPSVGSRPSGAKAWLLRNCIIIFVSAVVVISMVLLCVTQLKNKGGRHLCQHARAATHTHTPI